MHHLYCDPRSQEVLAHDKGRVLLLGGYQGYSNFGDILQLKGVIRWHAIHTGLQPVLVCQLASVSDPEFPTRLRRWFGIDSIIFYSQEASDVSPLGLVPLRPGARIPYLHVYGGGFLNSYWGSAQLAVIEWLHEHFGVGHYVLSGQQVDSVFSPQLRQHFARYRPLLAGGRDSESVDILSQCGAPAEYSFDDALEPLLALADVTRRVPSSAELDALIHLNNSHYTRQNTAEDGLADIFVNLRKLRAHLAKSNGGRHPSVGVIQAFDDCRVVDSLGVIHRLEDAFPFSEYRVVDLAQLAMNLWTADEQAPAQALRASMAITSSYHVTLFCNLLRIPCFFQVRNQYYQQKLSGLGPMDSSLDRFLLKPTVLHLDDQKQGREKWRHHLAEIFHQAPTSRQSGKVGSITVATGIAANSSPSVPRKGPAEPVAPDGGDGQTEKARRQLEQDHARAAGLVRRFVEGAEEWQQRLQAQRAELDQNWQRLMEERDRNWQAHVDELKAINRRNEYTHPAIGG